jgi:hypothetical protein
MPLNARHPPYARAGKADAERGRCEASASIDAVIYLKR